MGLERRNRQEYYYEKRREGGRVVSSYVAKGDKARLLAMKATGERIGKKAKRERQNRQMAEFREFEREIDALINEIEVLKDAHFRSCGYGKHKGQWRKQRAKR